MRPDSSWQAKADQGYDLTHFSVDWQAHQVLIVAGILDGPAEIQKAAGININLWMGIGMLTLGLLFLLWWRVLPVLRPVDPSNEVEPSAQHTAETMPDKDTSALFREHDG